MTLLSGASGRFGNRVDGVDDWLAVAENEVVMAPADEPGKVRGQEFVVEMVISRGG